MALGATRWQVVYRVLLPAAKNGLLAAVLLGVGRAVGETMAVLMATGHAVQIPDGLLDSVRTLTANIAAELGEAPAGSSHYRVLFLTGVLLFWITFVVNLTADLVVRGCGGSEPRWTTRPPRRSPRFARTAQVARTRARSRRSPSGCSSPWRWPWSCRCVAIVALPPRPRLAVARAGSSSSRCPSGACARGASGRRSWAPSTWSRISLAVAAPIGVLAAIYLNEYARDNWFNRLINLAVINLAGVPSIVHALFGLGAFVYAARFGYSILSASLTLAIMTLPVIIASTREALASVPMAFREACWNVGATRWQTIRAVVLPNSISGHPHRHHPAGQPGRRRDRADHVHRRRLLQGGAARRPVPVPPRRPVHGALHAPVHRLHPGAQRQGVDPLRHRRRAARLGAPGQRHAPSPCGSGCAAGRSGETGERGTASHRGRGPAPRLRRQGGPPRHLLRRPAATRSSPSSARPSPARPRCCAASTAPSTSSPAPPSPGTVRVDGEDVRRRQGRLRPAPQGRHGGAAAGRAAAVDLRQRRLRPALRRHARAGPTRRASSSSCLRQAALWDEVKDRLSSLGTALSGGQQQRLTIARALSHQPEILCLDEFSIAIDPVTTMRIEDVLKELRQEMTIILVTNLVQQARRLADRTMFLWNGEIVELGLERGGLLRPPGEPPHLRLRQRDLRMSAPRRPRHRRPAA